MRIGIVEQGESTPACVYTHCLAGGIRLQPLESHPQSLVKNNKVCISKVTNRCTERFPGVKGASRPTDACLCQAHLSSQRHLGTGASKAVALDSGLEAQLLMHLPVEVQKFFQPSFPHLSCHLAPWSRVVIIPAMKSLANLALKGLRMS